MKGWSFNKDTQNQNNRRQDFNTVFSEARFFIQNGNFEAAIQKLLIIYSQDPNNHEILLGLGECYLRLYKFDRAEIYANKVHQQNPERVEALLILTEIYRQKQLVLKCKDYLIKLRIVILKQQPDNYQMLDDINHQLLTYQHLEDTYGWLINDIYLPPSDMQKLLRKGLIAHMKGEFQEAISVLTELFANDPSKLFLRAYRDLTLCYIETNDFNNALETINNYIKIFPDENVGYGIKANILMYQSKFSEAEKSLHKAIEIDDKDERLWNLRAHIARERNNVPEMQRYLAKAEEIRQNAARVAQMRQRMGMDQISKHYGNLYYINFIDETDRLDIKEEDNLNTESDKMYNKALIDIQKGQYDDGLKTLQNLKNNENNLDQDKLTFQIGRCFLLMNKASEAEAIFKEMEERLPGNPAVQYMKLIAYDKQFHPEKIKFEIDRLKKLAPRDWRVWYMDVHMHKFFKSTDWEMESIIIANSLHPDHFIYFQKYPILNSINSIEPTPDDNIGDILGPLKDDIKHAASSMRLGNIDGAINTLEKIVELDTEKKFCYTYLLLKSLYSAIGKYDIAQNWMEKYRLKHPDLAEKAIVTIPIPV